MAHIFSDGFFDELRDAQVNELLRWFKKRGLTISRDLAEEIVGATIKQYQNLIVFGTEG